MKRLIVLRPEPGASATCVAARELDLEPVAIPLFRIEPVAWAAPDPAEFDGLLLTSANALRTAGPDLEKLLGLPVYAIGEATAAAAREKGFSMTFIGGTGIHDLLERIDPDLRLLHLCGEHRRQVAEPRQRITPVPVYRAAEISPPPDLSELPGAVVAVHSPRAGARLAELAALAGLDTRRIAVAAISAEAARSAAGDWQVTAIADAPNDSALLALSARLCNNPSQR